MVHPKSFSKHCPASWHAPGWAELQGDRISAFLSINAMAGFSNVGWAVNSFGLAMQDAAINSVQLKAELGVLSSGEILNRLGYHISLIGELVN